MSSLSQLGPLEAAQVLGSPEGLYIVMFHGYGADAFDLLSLHNHVDTPVGTNWIFPNAPISISIGGGFMGRAWFNIDIEAYDRAVRTGTHRDLAKTRPTGLDKAKTLALEMLKALHVPMNQIVLGGFSQGAMLATEIALTSAESPKALVILSGALLDEKNWKALKSKPFPFFQSHGTHDPILSHQGAQDLERLLLEKGFTGHLESFRGGHEIPESIINNLGVFLNRL